MTNHTSTIQEIYAALGRGDVAAILERIADQPDWGLEIPEHVPGAKAVPFFRNVRTKHDVANVYFGRLAQSIDLHRCIPTSFLSDADEVAVVIELDFTVKTTGRRVALDAVDLFKLGADGRVVQYRPFVDTALLIEAFGG